MTTEKWPIKNVQDFGERKILKAGRYKARLALIKQIKAPVYKKPDEIEDRLLFIFEPIEVALKDDESAAISISVRPSNGDRSKMYKLLCNMSPTGTVEDSIRYDTNLYQAYTEDMIGKVFNVTSEPSKNGKYNNATSVVYLEGGSNGETQKKSDDAWVEEANKHESFATMPDHGTTDYWYNIINCPKANLPKAQKLLRDNGASEVKPHYWKVSKEIEHLKNYKTVMPVELDNLPF